MGSAVPRGCCGRKALNRQIFIVGYLQFVERMHLHATLCSTGCFNSGKKTGQAAVHEGYRNTPEKMFCEDIRKFPKEMGAIYNQ